MLLFLNIKPNQRFNAVERSGDEWVIRVKAPAIDGKANEGLIRYLSDILELPKSRIVLKKGASSRLKCLDIDETEAIVLEKLSAAV